MEISSSSHFNLILNRIVLRKDNYAIELSEVVFEIGYF